MELSQLLVTLNCFWISVILMLGALSDACGEGGSDGTNWGCEDWVQQQGMMTHLYDNGHVTSQIAPTTKSMYITELYPDVTSDLSRVTWAHAANSQQALQDALQGDVMMIEADVLLGDLVGAEVHHNIPIMAHPPANTSDLSLEQFLEQIIQANKAKGAKLDFKQDEVISSSLALLHGMEDQITFPIWLNADVLPGPVKSTKIPINGESFINLCQVHYPNSTLSIGWTTRYGKDDSTNITSGNYTMKNVQDMANLLTTNQNQPVTFPVRAGLAANSYLSLQWLINQVQGSTLTIWSAAGDTVNAANLNFLIEHIGRDKVYVDVPEDLQTQLNNLNEDYNIGQRTIVSPSLIFLLISMLLIYARACDYF